jgi:nucleoside-diphosphate-sugar epimerase
MKALVTGGAGFVGRHLCKALLDKGWSVTCVDPVVERTGGKAPADWPLYDPRDYAQFRYVGQDCREFFRTNEEFDIVFHLAAMVGGRLMIEFDPLAVAEDLAIDADFYRYVLRIKPAKAVFFSSSAAYPISMQRKDSYALLKEADISFEDSIGMPDLSYGWAKLTGEYLARLAHQQYGLDMVCYRPFSGYGEDQDLSYPFPSICRRAVELAGSQEMVVWGTGDQMRDFIHITDCIEFVLKSMNSFSDGSAINLSTGRLTSFKEFAGIAANVVGYDPAIRGTSDKPEGVFARGGDRRLQNELGLVPTISFEEGIRRGVEYQRQMLSLAQ